jgi:hypothetical protein
LNLAQKSTFCGKKFNLIVHLPQKSSSRHVYLVRRASRLRVGVIGGPVRIQSLRRRVFFVIGQALGAFPLKATQP